MLLTVDLERAAGKHQLFPGKFKVVDLFWKQKVKGAPELRMTLSSWSNLAAESVPFVISVFLMRFVVLEPRLSAAPFWTRTVRSFVWLSRSIVPLKPLALRVDPVLPSAMLMMPVTEEPASRLIVEFLPAL